MPSANMQKPLNPHFDHNRVEWKDEYSGLYQPVEYDKQFDEQWKLFLERRVGFHRHTGVETSDPYIDDRIFELTGCPDYLLRRQYRALSPIVKYFRGLTQSRRGIGGKLYLNSKFAIEHFKGKRCLDIGCGAGRWTRTLMALGAQVKSVDVSPNALKSTGRFNRDVEALNLFEILEERRDLHEAFDFTLCWGVVMCTNDPKLAFANVCRTVKPGGQLYVMVYAPTYHNSPFVLESRKHYHTKLQTAEERLQYAYEIADRPENAINLLDMLNTFFNWTVEESVIRNWYLSNGFTNVISLNKDESNKCAYHMLGTRTR